MTALPRHPPRRGIARPQPTRPARETAETTADQTSTPAGGGTEPLLYTAEQAAELLQVRPSWLRRKAAARAVPCRFVGKTLAFLSRRHQRHRRLQCDITAPNPTHLQQLKLDIRKKLHSADDVLLSTA
jgi:hypothetical protein